MADYPPLSRFYVASYAANDRDYPVVAIRLDPRTAGYKVPEDLSPHPDSKRYPNHVFTGAQPASGDQIVTHIYEILPAPWVPFTRYDDDLGPIQGRRRSVKNEGQVASLSADKRVTYEAREGSAIVYTEIEEAWSIETDDDGNSLFPIRDRDFYDASRGAVQERRQLFVPTGEEEGTLENVNGVITQTSYEPYNEFLSVKIVQTYKVDGPLLIGKATDEARQLATVTTQRKGAADYVPPNPTATRTVEVSREDAESLVERVVEVPQVFGAEAYRKTREDITPQKFKAAQEDTVFEQTIEGTANPNIVLGAGEFVKSEEQVNKFTKRVATTSRSITSAVTLSEKVLTPQGQIGTRLLRLDVGDQSFTPSATLIDASVEALGDGRTVKTEVTVPSVFTSKTIRKTRLDLTPEKFRAAQADTIIEENLAGAISSPSAITLGAGEFSKSEEQVTEFVKRVSTNTRDISAAEILTETVITPQGQMATRTLRLTADPQSIQPDALLIDGSIEALGDQRTIKTEVRVPNVFEGKSLSLEKPDVTPQKFRANVPSTVVERSIAGTVGSSITLTGSEISKSEQQVTEFVKRVRTEERDPAVEGLVQGEAYTTELGGGVAQVTERYGASVNISPSYGTVSAEKEALGDGKFATREVELSNPPELVGQIYDESLDIVFPFTQKFVNAEEVILGDARTEITPRDVFHSLRREVDIDAFKASVLNQHWKLSSFSNITFPDYLYAVRAVYSRSSSRGRSRSYNRTGTLGLSSQSSANSSSNSSSASGDAVYFIRNGYSGPVPSTRHVFFLDKNSATNQNILNAVNAQYSPPNNNVTNWPIVFPQPVVVCVFGSSYSYAQSENGVYLPNGNNVKTGSSTNSSSGSSVSQTIIPPTLHEEITIANGGINDIDSEVVLEEDDAATDSSLVVTQTGTLFNAVQGGISSQESKKIPATTPSKFPSGNFLVNVESEAYRHGLVRISCVVVHVSPQYVAVPPTQ
jgi:hypothetical protein